MIAMLCLCGFLFAPSAEAKEKPSLRKVSRAEQALNRCVKNVSSRLKSIEKVYYPKLAKRGPSGVKAWFARKDLEVARWYLHGDAGWKAARGTGCGPEMKKEPKFKALEAEWDRMELLVQELERVKGVVFVEVKDPNDIIYNDVKTGEPVKRASSY